MINLIAWLVVGGILGWVASMIMRTDAQQGVGLNIVVGIVGALVAGFLISPLVGLPTINDGANAVTGSWCASSDDSRAVVMRSNPASEAR